MPETFTPAHRPISGTLRVPGDKSISHRAILMAAAAEGASHLSGVLDSADVRSTIGAVEALGAEVHLEKAFDGTLRGEVIGWGGRGPMSPEAPIDCGNSGTTTRLLMGLIAGYDCTVTLTGDASLSKRPMARVTEPLSKMDARFSSDTLPITVSGSSSLKGVDYETPVASAQVKSAILLAGLRASGTTRVTEPAFSRDHTERMLPLFGAEVSAGDLTSAVEGPQVLSAADIAVPGDPSSAAYLLAAAAMSEGGDVTVKGISLNPTRIGFLTVMRRMGAHIITTHMGDIGAEPYGNVTVKGDSQLTATTVPVEEIPSIIDEVPLLALLATCAQGTSCFLEVGELRVKESDRLSAIVDGLGKLGCSAYVRDDNLFVEGGKMPQGTVSMETLGDHRLAMCWALAGTLFDATVTVDDADCMSVSYPNFLRDLAWATRNEPGED